jgi:hypothetical protein
LTPLVTVECVGVALTTDLVERMVLAARAGLFALTLRFDVVDCLLPPPFGPSVLWLDDGERAVVRSAWASPVPTVKKEKTPTVTTPVPSQIETSL